MEILPNLDLSAFEIVLKSLTIHLESENLWMQDLNGLMRKHLSN